MAPFHQILPLPQLLPAGARGFALVDLVTTGTGQLCRIVEIALLLLTPDGEIEQEWSTVINPGVPIPNAAVHGIDERLAAAAPSFSVVAPTLEALLEGRVVVAHNLDRFDCPILRHHFWEASEAWPELVLDLGDGIDTMPIPSSASASSARPTASASRAMTLTPPSATRAPWPRCSVTAWPTCIHRGQRCGWPGSVAQSWNTRLSSRVSPPAGRVCSRTTTGSTPP
jgi:hypothetical protein